MRGVILAAGYGSRLSMSNGKRPKVLLPIAGRAIIEHTLEAFSQVGVTDLGVVIGYQGDAVKEWVGDGSRYGLRIQYIYNPDYQLGIALSVYAARSFTNDEPFLLSMADHMISYDMLARILGFQESGNVLGVNFEVSPRDMEEGTRVLVNEDSLVTDIGKDLRRWNGIDVGVFQLTSAVFKAIEDILGEERNEYQLSQAIIRMIDAGYPLWACDVSGCFWHDVDTLEDLNYMEEKLAG